MANWFELPDSSPLQLGLTVFRRLERLLGPGRLPLVISKRRSRQSAYRSV